MFILARGIFRETFIETKRVGCGGGGIRLALRIEMGLAEGIHGERRAKFAKTQEVRIGTTP